MKIIPILLHIGGDVEEPIKKLTDDLSNMKKIIHNTQYTNPKEVSLG